MYLVVTSFENRVIQGFWGIFRAEAKVFESAFHEEKSVIFRDLHI